MEDSDFVCPLCCEELDISDREFYPCKCGYQVCMWCWHRIRESESGLCPACRTPYGEDPHQFSAVDVEEVLKANKEKEAAAKRERQRQQLDEDGIAAMEVPKDRTQLANMRVIRRNLVYAVGLPPHIATEEILKRPEFFGQYGKISKIVINRTQATGDPRRASASAYVTFVHKEDTLACILALDGFYFENRNIRASYGTSKYCSAFIKNVRCNNPECTYLHEMGAAEDTFTKQEIQAGYVTSGRDVLARQQQIVAEQLRAGSMGPTPRKKIGGGGPSGTGKASTNPVFPIPEYDEPAKSPPPLVPGPQGIARSQTTQVVTLNPANISAKLGRSNSVGGPTIGGKSPTLGPVPAIPVAVPIAQHRKTQSGGAPAGVHMIPAASIGPTPAQAAAHAAAATHNASSASSLAAATTAASVVAAGRKAEPADPHVTLTPLTPLKRTSKPSRPPTTALPSTETPAAGLEKLAPLRNGTASKKQQQQQLPTMQPPVQQLNGSRSNKPAGFASESDSMSAFLKSEQSNAASGLSLIGGDVIAAPLPSQPRAVSAPIGVTPHPVGSSFDSLGGQPISLDSFNDNIARPSALGGEVYTGELPRSNKSAIGSHSGKWNATAPVGGTALNTGPMLSGGMGSSAAPGSGLWNNAAPSNLAPGPSAVGGSVIGSSRAPGSSFGGFSTNSSSALASILGINLPTGSGSLHETSSSLWSSGPQPAAPGPSPLASLNVNAVPTHDIFGGRNFSGGSSLIGGVPITSSTSTHMNGPGTIGSSNKSDIALLQSLLPGVHITSGNESLRFAGAPQNWNNAAPGRGPGGLNGEPIGGSNWNGGGIPQSTAAGIGAIGQNSGASQNQRRAPGIW